MAVLIAFLTLLLLALVAALVSAPLREGRLRAEATRESDADARATLAAEDGPALIERERELDELAAEREAKYREIRDTELDYRTGKLSKEDYETIDAELRAEAIEILNRLERLTPKDA